MSWREDNNIGNSYSNLFGDIDDFEIAHIYCRDGMPYNKKVRKYFQITEHRLVKHFWCPSVQTGRSFEMDASQNVKDLYLRSKVVDKFRILRWESLFIVRDLIWGIGKWKTAELYKFVEDFQPDLIFGTLTYMSNINRMMVDLQKRYQLPLILYSWDDVYSWHHFSWNPLFILRKCYNRHYIRKCVSRCEKMYVITQEMQEEYRHYFNMESKILYKSYDFSKKESKTHKKTIKPYNVVFMGNIGAGRWKALAQLAKVIKNINQKEDTAFLNIYTLSPLSNKIRTSLNIVGASKLHSAVSQDEVMRTQQNADVLVHVEPLNKREASFYRLSFSTKLVDYFYNARCIVGMGTETATLSYIKRNDAGVVIYDLHKVKEVLCNLFDNPELMNLYGYKAWECGVKNHERKIIRKMLIEDMQSVLTHKWSS